MKTNLFRYDLLIVLTLLLISSASSVFGQAASENQKESETVTQVISTASDSSVEMPEPDAVAKYFPKPNLDRQIVKGTLPAASPTGSDDWQLQITPYLWAPQLEGNLRVRNQDVRVDASASSLVGMLDFTAAVHFEAVKRKYGFFLDEFYVNLGTEAVRPNGNVTRIEPVMNIFEAGAMYAPIIIPNENGTGSEPLPPKFTLEILGGMRVFYMSIGIDPTNVSAVEGSRTFVDVFAGNRINFRPVPRFTISGKYTVGGGGSHFSWSGNLMADYRFRKNISFNGGYQILDINADKASNTVGFNGRLRGMIFGLTIFR